MNEQRLNTSAKWKKVFCVVVLLFYFSYIWEPIGNPIVSTIYSLSTFAVPLIMLPDLIRELKKFKCNKKSLLFIPLGLVLLFVFQAVLWEIAKQIITSSMGITIDDANENNLREMIAASPVFMSYMICVHGPILEELLYRYTGFGLLYEKNRILAYALTSFMFGIQHVALAGIWGEDWYQLINMPGYILGGLIFAFLYDKTKNLWVPIGAHILLNTIGTMISLLVP
jgi:membrane protease YdiL (CAAX protease family)